MDFKNEEEKASLRSEGDGVVLPMDIEARSSSSQSFQPGDTAPHKKSRRCGRISTKKLLILGVVLFLVAIVLAIVFATSSKEDNVAPTNGAVVGIDEGIYDGQEEETSIAETPDLEEEELDMFEEDYADGTYVVSSSAAPTKSPTSAVIEMPDDQTEDTDIFETYGDQFSPASAPPTTAPPATDDWFMINEFFDDDLDDQGCWDGLAEAACCFLGGMVLRGEVSREQCQSNGPINTCSKILLFAIVNRKLMNL